MKGISTNIPDFIDASIIGKLQDVLKAAFSFNEPIRIAVIGESGVGKTSTINALFKTNLPVSHFGSCTQEAGSVKAVTPRGVQIEIIDMPGLWAGEAETKRHWETYKKILPTVDCAIWVISAGDRALQGMQNALETMATFLDLSVVNNIVFGINKAEHMHPEDWNNLVNLPSAEQQENLNKFCTTVINTIHEKFPDWNGKLIYYSAKKQFRLNELLEQMLISATPDTRLKVIRAANPVSYEDKVEDKRALDVAKKMMKRGE